MKHKIKVYATPRVIMAPDSYRSGWGWYAICDCGWDIPTRYTWTDGVDRWARPHWDAAFALGVAHLRQECKHV